MHQDRRHKTSKKLFVDSNMKIDKSDWHEVFSASLGKTMANQLAFSELIAKRENWKISFGKGIISFGESDFPIQFLGNESISPHTWLWGWENINNFSDDILETAKSAKEIGAAWNLEQLTIPEFQVSDTLDGHAISIVTASICTDKVCYYRCPHTDGAFFVALYNLPDEVFAPTGAVTFADVVTQCLKTYAVDSHIFIKSFLYQNDTPYEEDGDSIIAHFEQNLKIDFEKADGDWRISHIKTV